MHSLIDSLKFGTDLTTAQVGHAVAQLVSPDVTDEVKADFLKSLRAKGETAAEIAEFVRAVAAEGMIAAVFADASK